MPEDTPTRNRGSTEPELSVLVPVYNERDTLQEILRRVEGAPYRKQIVVVDDGSTDGTRQLLETYRERDGYTVLFHRENRGKGAALRTAIPHARAEASIVQDGDLEYDPRDYPSLVEIIREGRADVVYGSRYLNPENDLPWTKFRIGVHALNLLVGLLYGQRITDEATCYKAFRTSLLQDIHLTCERFEFCPEITARVRRRGHRIVEVPIRYHYRTVEQGKKVDSRDFVEAIVTLLRCRVFPERPRE